MALPVFVQGSVAKAADMNAVVDAVATNVAVANNLTNSVAAVDTKATTANTLATTANSVATAAQTAASAAAQAIIDEATTRAAALIAEADARTTALNATNTAVQNEANTRAAADTATLAAAQLEMSTQIGVQNEAISQARNIANQALTASNSIQTGGLLVSNIPAYANEAEAITGGVKYNGLYRVGNAINIVTTPDVVVAPPTEPVAPEPTTPGAPPAGWNRVFFDDFTVSARTGIDAIDGSKWGHRGYGGSAHRGSSVWNSGASHEATGTTARIHVKKTNNVWYVDGFQQGIQTTNPAGYAYHPGYGEFHCQFRARYSHARAAGVGAYALMWQADDSWGSEIDWVEMPGEYKTQAMATMHQDFTGEYNLNGKLPDGSDRDKYSSAYKTVNLNEWHVWDCRRTYTLINGVIHATIRIWIDGEELTNTPANWKNTRFLTKPMVFGAASFVSPNELAAWYTVPNSATPTDSWLELDYVYIWTPDGEAPPSGGDGTVVGGTKTLSLSSVTPTAGTWNVNILQTNMTAVSWVVINGAPNYEWISPTGNEYTITNPNASTAISPVFTANGQALMVWETGNMSNARYSNAVTGF